MAQHLQGNGTDGKPERQKDVKTDGYAGVTAEAYLKFESITLRCILYFEIEQLHFQERKFTTSFSRNTQ